jgi:hypothetical protein
MRVVVDGFQARLLTDSLGAHAPEYANQEASTMTFPVPAHVSKAK